MSIPAETYSYGLAYIYLVLSNILVVPTLTYIIVPVFYENNIANCYEVRNDVHELPCRSFDIKMIFKIFSSIYKYVSINQLVEL